MATVKAKTGGHDNAFIPTSQEITLSVFFGLLLLVTVNLPKFVDYYQDSARVVGYGEQSFRFEFIKNLNPQVLPTIETFLIWSLIGLMFYLIIWFLFSILGEAGHEASVIHGFMFPKKSDRNRYELAMLKRVGIRLVGLIASALWLLLLLTKILPACSVYFYQAFTINHSIDIIGKAIVSVACLGAYLYLIAPPLRMIVLKPRLFTDW